MEDLLINISQELDVQDGDFAIGESTIQHQDLLINTSKGEWKENPLVAVGAAAFLKDEDVAGLMAEIKTQFEKDGMTVKKIDNANGILTTDARY